jgi:hypothetical protein
LRIRASDPDERGGRSRVVWLEIERCVDQHWRGTKREEERKRRRELGMAEINREEGRDF